MKVYGALEAAQIEWFTNAGKPSASSYPFRVIYVTDLKQIQVSDGTNWNPSALYTYTAGTLPAAGASNQYQVAFITDTLQVKVSNGTEWKTIGARLDTYTSGTIPAAASNTNSIIWVSDLQQVQVSNGSSWVQVGSKAGTKNYFSQNNANPDFETNSVSPWSACTLTFSSGAPSGAPTLTATQMAIATTATTPLSGTYSMSLTKSAANAQYQGFISGALTIDREDTAKVLYGSFYYEVVSGTIDLSGSSTQSLEIWIYNTVSGQWTQPAGYRGMNQSSGVGKVVFSFQTDGTFANNAYKIAVITQQTGTSAFVVEFDDFVVGPQAIVLGSAMTDWQSYTPTFTGFGTATNIEFQYRRVGSDLEIRGKFTSGTTTATEARITFPSGLTSSDVSRIPSIQLAGYGARSVINAAYNYNMLIEPSVTYLTIGAESPSLAGLTKLNGSIFLVSGDAFSFFAKIPIQGWASFSQVSSDTDTRVVAAQVTGDAASATSGNPIILPTTTYDTHAAYNATTGRYTVPVSGYYRCHGSLESTVSTNVGFFIYKNAVSAVRVGVSDASGDGSFTGTVLCNAGDLLDLRPNNTYDAATSTTLNFERISGPSVITATETVAASYCISAAAATAINVQFNFDSKIFDSHNAVTTGAGTWKFTAPVSGKYQVSSSIIHTALNNTMTIFKNGSLYRNMGYNITNSASGASIPGITTIQLNAGEYIDVRSGSNTVTPTAGLFSGATLSNSNFIDIVRIGN